jgi:hypothetical protein
MLRKSILLAAAATAALGFAVFNPSFAEARGHGGHGGGMHRGGGGHHGHGHRGHHGRGHHGHHGRHHHHRHRHWHVRWHRPVWYGYSYARPVAGPCTCLSKEYTSEGAVLFKDRCTNEMAMNPPMQQTGALDQQQPPQAAYQQQSVQPQPQNMQPQASYAPQYPPQAPAAR